MTPSGVIVGGEALNDLTYTHAATDGATVAGEALNDLTYTHTATDGATVAGSATVPISVSPLSIANGFLSVLRTDTISEAEFPNAVIGNGYLSVLYQDTIL